MMIFSSSNTSAAAVYRSLRAGQQKVRTAVAFAVHCVQPPTKLLDEEIYR